MNWIKLDGWLDFLRIKCSCCGQIYSIGKDVVFNYCPNCGKKYESVKEKRNENN